MCSCIHTRRSNRVYHFPHRTIHFSSFCYSILIIIISYALKVCSIYVYLIRIDLTELYIDTLEEKNKNHVVRRGDKNIGSACFLLYISSSSSSFSPSVFITRYCITGSNNTAAYMNEPTRPDKNYTKRATKYNLFKELYI